MTLYFFDTHAHIQLPRGQRTGEMGNLLCRACNVGICALLVPSVTQNDWLELEKLSPPAGLQLVYAWGLHPYFVCKITKEEALHLVEELEERVRSARLISSNSEKSRLCAIGECGLDFSRARTPGERDKQVEVFRRQLELARETGLPLSIHCVKAHGPMLELLRERATPPSVMHAFSGSAELARALVEAGHYISFAANVCIVGARKVHAAARAVPADRLLIETDSPDQTPPGRRPAPNEPAFIVDVAARLAELRGVSLAEIAASTLANGRRVFALAPPRRDPGADPARDPGSASE